MDTNNKNNFHKDWHHDAANWKAGFIYFNRNDKRILVPKRLGIGWTFNFANPVAIWLTVVLIAVPVIVVFAGVFMSNK